MKKTKLLLLLRLFVVLMTVFGNVCAQEAQDTSLPAFRIANVAVDEKVTLSTKNFPADSNYMIYMATADDPENFTPVAKFNSKAGGNLNVTVKIPEKFQGLYTINLMLKDENGGTIAGNFINNPDAAPVEEPIEEPAEEPVEEPAEEPVEEPAEEPVEEPAEEPVEEPAEEPVEEPAEEPVEEPAEEPVGEPAEEPVEEPAEEPVEEPAEEPAGEPSAPIIILNRPENEEPAEEPVEEPVEQPADEKTAEEPAEEPVTLVNEQTIQEPAAAESTETTCNNCQAGTPVVQPVTCNYSLVPYITINSVTKNTDVTFTTYNFPADTDFIVSMGYYESHCVPGAPKPECPTPEAIEKAKKQECVIKHGPYAGEIGHIESVFNGTPVPPFNTGDGSSRTLTYTIPSNLRGVSPITIWMRDPGECGFYSYNYFYNATTNW